MRHVHGSIDLPGTAIYEIDHAMDRVHGDHVHQNDGSHLDSGITSDTTWQAH
jgi:hypothetical protein